jgi:hypothetical protein
MGKEFPKFSISIYDSFDGVEFSHPRQQINGKQILSTIVSDNYFPSNNYEAGSDNYLNGVAYQTFVFYAKIILFSADTDTNPSSYVFKKTFNGETEVCLMSLISKQTDYAVYWSSFSIPASDYVSQLDGDIFFTVESKVLSVEIETPLTINCSNSGIVDNFTYEPDSPIQILANSVNSYSQFFVNSFLLSQLSWIVSYYNTNVSGNGYDQPTQNNPTIVFDPTQAFYNFYGSLFELQINFLKNNFIFSVNFFDSNISYFGCTLLTNDGLLDLRDVNLNLYLKADSGKMYNIEPKIILANRINPLAYNFIFEFTDKSSGTSIFLPSDKISEANLRIDLNTFPSSINLFTTLTYFNFLQTNESDSFSALSNNQNLYVVNILEENQNYFEIFKQYPLMSENGYCLAESYLEIESDAAYRIKTQNFEILLDEFMVVSTNVGFIPVSSLTNQNFIKTIDGFESIENILVFSGKKPMILDTFGQNSYYLNGILVKNPFYIKKFIRSFIPSINRSALQYSKSVTIGDQEYFAIKHGSMLVFEINKKITSNLICDVQINFEFKKIAIIFDSSDVVYYKVNAKNYETKQNIIVTGGFSGKITLRCRKDLIIKDIYLS